MPTNSESINNNNLVGNAINSGHLSRACGCRGCTRSTTIWNALLTQSYQNMNAQGVFYEMPYGPEGLTFNSKGEPIGVQALPPLSVTLFNPSYDKDKFENTALTVNGKIGDLKLVYSGGYLVRNIEQQQDYTNYARGVFGYYYQCAGYSSKSAAPGSATRRPPTWQETEKNTHQSHELRVSTPDDWRMRGIGGVYWEEFKIYDDTDWMYKTVPTCSPTFDDQLLQQRPALAGRDGEQSRACATTTSDSSTTRRAPSIQKAAFGSVDVDIIPKTLTFTAGTRYYHFNEIGARRRRRQLLLQGLRADHLLRSLHLGNQRQRKAGRVGPTTPAAPHTEPTSTRRTSTARTITAFAAAPT